MKTTNLIAVVVWGSFVACLPMFMLSLIFEGPSSFVASYHAVSWLGIVSLAYIVFASTWLGYGIWGWLIGHYPVGTIVPFTLLVPVVGIISSVLVFGEPFQQWKFIACLLVITGLCINIISPRFFITKSQPEKS
jgi:O-acetylserine/cysteine efflux transporter